MKALIFDRLLFDYLLSWQQYKNTTLKFYFCEMSKDLQLVFLKTFEMDNMWNLKVVLLLIILKVCQQVIANDEKPFLKIVAPKFICENDKGSQNISKESENKTNAVIISLQTKKGQKLKYNIDIEFNLLTDGGFISQKHTLSIWKNIRNLQKKFQSQSNEISDRNQIQINIDDVSKKNFCYN
jgi:hypothetical protein